MSRQTHTLAAMTATLNAGACSAQAADIEFWYGNTGVVEAAINAQCAAFRAPQTQDRITCVGRAVMKLIGRSRSLPMGKSLQSQLKGIRPADIVF